MLTSMEQNTLKVVSFYVSFGMMIHHLENQLILLLQKRIAAGLSCSYALSNNSMITAMDMISSLCCFSLGSPPN